MVGARGARDARGTDPILVNSYGDRWRRTSLSELFARIAKRAGVTRVEARAHSFRHALNVLARTSGLEVQQRAAMLNHVDTRMLAQYDHEMADDAAHARSAVWGVVRGLGSKANGAASTPANGDADGAGQ